MCVLTEDAEIRDVLSISNGAALILYIKEMEETIIAQSRTIDYQWEPINPIMIIGRPLTG